MSFDRLAPHYRWMEWVLAGEKLQRCRTAYLDRLSGATNLLMAGEGPGRFLVACCRRLPAARLTVVEASAGMLREARRRLAREGLAPERVRFVQANVLDWSPTPQGFDAIATHFFLDCFPEEQLSEVVAHLGRLAAPRAAWLLADFQVPAHGLARHRARAIHALMYAFFRATTEIPARRLAPPDESLRAHGFTLIERQTSDRGLLRSDFWRRVG